MNKIETIISSESKYLNRLKLIQSQETGWPSMPATAPVLAMFLADFRPAYERAARGDNMTSAEIIGAMEDICAFSTSEVAIVMSYLGYRLSVNNYRGLEWSMVAVTDEDVDSLPQSEREAEE